MPYCKDFIKWLTCWCRKKVAREMHANPICLKILRTLLAEPPATKIANDKRKLPAGILVSSTLGWLLQAFSFFLQWWLLQIVTTFAIVPNRLTSTEGSGILHDGHVLNNSKSCDKNTTNFGWVLKLPSVTHTLRN